MLYICNLYLYLQQQPISVFLDITKVANLWWKHADATETQWVCNVINAFWFFFR